MQAAPSKILYITYNGSGEPIFQSQVLPLICCLAQKGYKVHLLSFERKGTDTGIGAILKENGIQWHKLRYHKRPPLPSTVFDIMMGALYGTRLVKLYNIDLIHARQVVCAFMGYLIKKLARVKLLYDMRGKFAEEKLSHGWKPNGIKYRLVKFCDNLLLKNSDGLVVLTSHHYEEIKDNQVALKHKPLLEKIPCSVDVKRFQFSADKRVSLRRQLQLDNKFVLVYSGSLGTCYFFNEMLDFFKTAKDYFNNQAFFLLLINNIFPEIHSSVKDKGIADSDFRVIHVQSEEVPAYLSVADTGIYFINSYMKSTSFPIKFGEFLSCGLPVILNAGIGDTDRIVREHGVGVVIERFDKIEYQRAMAELSRVLSKRETISASCRQIATQYLAVDEAANKYSAMYEAILIEGIKQ